MGSKRSRRARSEFNMKEAAAADYHHMDGENQLQVKDLSDIKMDINQSNYLLTQSAEEVEDEPPQN